VLVPGVRQPRRAARMPVRPDDEGEQPEGQRVLEQVPGGRPAHKNVLTFRLGGEVRQEDQRSPPRRPVTSVEHLASGGVYPRRAQTAGIKPAATPGGRPCGRGGRRRDGSPPPAPPAVPPQVSPDRETFLPRVAPPPSARPAAPPSRPPPCASAPPT